MRPNLILALGILIVLALLYAERRQRIVTEAATAPGWSLAHPQHWTPTSAPFGFEEMP